LPEHHCVVDCTALRLPAGAELERETVNYRTHLRGALETSLLREHVRAFVGVERLINATPSGFRNIEFLLDGAKATGPQLQAPLRTTCRTGSLSAE